MYLGPPRLATFCFLGERRKVDLSARERTDVVGVGVPRETISLARAATALPLDFAPPKGLLRGEHSEQIAPP